jgi:hypothetical protein
VVVAKHDGSRVSGRIVNFNGGTIHGTQNLFNPSAVTSIPERDIESITRSRVSLMPAGMLNSLTADEILDLLAFLRSGLDGR